MRQELADYLTSTTNVTNWDAINFGIMPDEAPKGYLFLASVFTANKVRVGSLWGVAIAISALSLNQLNDDVSELAYLIADAFKSPIVCIPGLGSVQLSGSIEVESPQSYPNQGNISKTTGFFTALTFILEIN